MANRVKAIANTIETCVPDLPHQSCNTHSVAEGAQPFTGKYPEDIYFRWMLILGCKDLAGTNNAATVQFGWGGNGTLPMKVTPGGTWVLEAPLGTMWKIGDLYMAVGAEADGLVFIYT